MKHALPESDLATVKFQSPSPSVSGSMSSQLPLSPSPARPPPKRRPNRRSPSPDLGMIAEGAEDIPPEVQGEFQSVSPPMALMPPPDRYVGGTGHPLSDPRYPTGDDFVSYSDVPVERRVIIHRPQKRRREEVRAEDRPLAAAKRTRVEPEGEDEFAYWPYLAFGGVLILLAYITEDPRSSPNVRPQ